MDAKELIKGIRAFKDELSGVEKKVLKTFPMKSEWVEKFAILEDLTEQIAQMEAKRQSLRQGFWSTVELESEIYDKQMRVNKETNEIEVLED
jgi:hypothetical protein